MSKFVLHSLRLGSLALLASFVASTAFAHHSASGQYDVQQKIVLEGTVEKVDWVNPHIYVHLKVTDQKGASVIWRLGTVPVAMARKAGVTKESLLAEGQKVKITAYPAREAGSNMGFLVRIDYPDGHFVSVNPDRL